MKAPACVPVNNQCYSDKFRQIKPDFATKGVLMVEAGAHARLNGPPASYSGIPRAWAVLTGQDFTLPGLS
jgi:hypothetical protein